MFAGCNLLEINKQKYYNEAVVVVSLQEGYGDAYKSYEKTYTKKDLLTAYYNYSYEYVAQGQITDIEYAMNYAINNMVNADLLYTYVKLNYYDNPAYDLDFTDADKNDAKLAAFDSMQNSIFEIEAEVFEEWDIEFTDSEELSADEAQALRASYEAYTPSVTVQVIDGKEVIVLDEVAVDAHDTRVAPEHFVQEIRDPEVSREAYTRYIKKLQDAAKAEGRDNSETAVLLYEEEALIESNTRSKYLTKFENWYNKYFNFTYDSENQVYVLNEDIQDSIVETYKQNYIEQRDTYTNSKEAYHTAMGDKVDNVYYHANSGNEYVYVSHILLKFSDAQVKQIKELDTKLANKLISQARYDELVQDIANRTVVKYEMDGKTYTSTADKVYNKISNYVNTGDEILSNPNADADEKQIALVEKAKRFNDMLYMYNDDEGIMNADYAYVVNLDTNVTDKMVKPFADKAREMHADGIKGAMSDMVITEYGVHIMFYCGEVTNVVDDIDTLTAIDLIKRNTQLSSAKSLFSLAYDQLSSDKYSSNVTNFIADCRINIVNVEKIVDNYKDLLKK